MPESTNIKSSSIISFEIKVNGKSIDDFDSVLSIHVEKAVNKISSARLTILDGNADTGNFKVSSSSTFVPGNEITIEAGYDTKNNEIFTGIITGQSIKINNIEGSMLIVECQDPAVKMTVGRKNKVFRNEKDSSIISNIISNYSGLSFDVTATDVEWPELVQYYCTDWDFIISRAEINGLIAMTNKGRITIASPLSDTSPVLTIKYGDNLLSLNADLNSTSQLDSVMASSWDFKTQSTVSGKASNTLPGAGNLSSKKLSEVVGLSEYQLQTFGSLDSEELTVWSKAQMLKNEFAKILGEVEIQGTSLAEPGKYLTLEGVGDRFNGDYLISSVHHTVADGNWITEVEIGLSPQWIMEEPDVVAPSTSGLLPGTQGLYSGVVKQMYKDPDSQFKVLVTIPLFDKDGEGIWARLSNFYSTNGAGAYFLPEVGDEVVLGFLNEDPRYPIILGSLYSSKNKPSEGLTPNEMNSVKAIVTKSKLSIEFDDERKVLTIATPGKNIFKLSDEDENITLEDQNGNSITLSSSGISLKCPKDVSIHSDQKVSISGTQGVNISASGGDIDINGMNIKQSADMEYSAEGAATASVKGGAELTLTGAMIMIN